VSLVAGRVHSDFVILVTNSDGTYVPGLSEKAKAPKKGAFTEERRGARLFDSEDTGVRRPPSRQRASRRI